MGLQVIYYLYNYCKYDITLLKVASKSVAPVK